MEEMNTLEYIQFLMEQGMSECDAERIVAIELNGYLEDED